MENSNKIKEVLTNDMPHIGIEYGIHKVVPCPEEYKDKYEDDIWIFSKKRNEAVRLFSHEYEIVK